MRNCLIALISFWFAQALFAADNVLNIYTWTGVIPDSIIRQFEKETGIEVNFSTYESNEMMYAKLKTGEKLEYDIIEPSSYYIDRMSHQGLLEKLDHTQLSHFNNLDPDFLNQAYDPQNQYSIPYIWGTTGIFVNRNDPAAPTLHRWADLWEKNYKNQLLLIDDVREVFAMALLTLGYSINDTDPKHIKQAYLKLKELLPNIKIFKSDAILTILVDEDATIGMAWNGELYKAKQENPGLEFVYPAEGFVIWIDSFAILKNAPHRENAYKFINFMLRADIAKAVSLSIHFPSLNLAARKQLPRSIRDNPIIYPSHDTLRRGHFQRDIDDAALELYEKYWEKIKMGG